MKISKFTVALLIVTFTACNQADTVSTEKKMEMPVAVKDTAKDKFDGLTYAVKKDLVCGMPVSAGVNDTSHYKGKIYGFCAAECKAEFIKNPEMYLTAK
jgi:YHS domain-containing protein